MNNNEYVTVYEPEPDSEYEEENDESFPNVWHTVNGTGEDYEKNAEKLLKEQKLQEKKDPIIKITLFKCNDGLLHISDIELVSKDIIDNSKLRTINKLDKDPIRPHQTEFISNKGKVHDKIMSIYLVLSKPVNIMLGEVIDVTKPTNEPMLEQFYNIKNRQERNSMNNGLCTIHFSIDNFVMLLDDSEIFYYIVKLQIITNELVKNLFEELMVKKKQNQNSIPYVPTDIETIRIKIDKIMEENEILKNTELKILYKFINELITNEHTMDIQQLKDFYTNLKTRIGVYVRKILEKRGDLINIDTFKEEIYDQFITVDQVRGKTNKINIYDKDKRVVEMIDKNKIKNDESAISIYPFDEIKNSIISKISSEYSKPTYDPLKSGTNPIKQHNDLILIRINNSIENAEYELERDNANDEYFIKHSKGFLVLKKNYLIIMFVMTYIKMQYIIYDEHMTKTGKTSNIMNIELLSKLYDKTIAKMEAIFKAAYEIGGSNHTDDINKLKVAFAEVKSALLTSKVTVEEKYEKYTTTKSRSWLKKGGTNKKKGKGGKHTRKGNRKI